MSDQNDVLMEAIVAVVRPLLAALEAQIFIARHLHPPILRELVDFIGTRDSELRSGMASLAAAPWPDHLSGFRDQLGQSAEAADRVFQDLRAAADHPEGMMQAYRALRHHARSLEALYPVASALRPVSQFFLEAGARGDGALLDRLARADPAAPNVGVLHVDNERDMRGGFSVYMPETYDPARAYPVVFALHGGSGHGRTFLWTWIREARSRGIILVSPTASEATWSLMEPGVDGPILHRILDFIGQTWKIDRDHLLLTGMSDGGTFTFVSGLTAGSPFTHLAPIAASFHPMLLGFVDPGMVRSRPIYLVHGARDWMFPIDIARTARQSLEAAGATVTYREIADLSHTYPREENGPILDWFLGRTP